MVQDTFVAEDTIIIAARPLRRPVHPFPMSWLLLCLLACLATDLTYWRTAAMMWSNFSAWLVTAAAALALLTLIAAVFDIVSGRLAWIGGGRWLVALGYLVVFVLAVINAMVHTHDAWTSVVPWGFTLSIITVLLALAIGIWTWVAARQQEV